MKKRWTEEDLKNLPAGMVKAADLLPGQLPAPAEIAVRKPGKAAELQALLAVPSTAAGMQALGRLPAGVMNKTEARYAQHLELRKQAGEVLWYEFEPMNLRLASECFYRVDFMVLTADFALEAHEVKGRWTDDALIKIKVAAKKFPFRFIAVRWVKGEWEPQNF